MAQEKVFEELDETEKDKQGIANVMDNTKPLEDVEIYVSPTDLVRGALRKAIATQLIKTAAKSTIIKSGRDLFKKEATKGAVKLAEKTGMKLIDTKKIATSSINEAKFTSILKDRVKAKKGN